MDVRTRAERDRLLANANVARMRGDFAGMEEALRQAVALAGEDADLIELIGDALHGQGKLAEARDCYKKALDMQSGRASAETRFARVVLEIDEIERQKRESLLDLERPRDRLRQRRRTGSAILALIFPGLGQLVNGEIVKGGVLMGVFIVSLIVLAVLPDTGYALRQVLVLFGGSSPAAGAARQGMGWLFPLVAGAAAFCWVYSIVDALTEATKDLAAKRKDGSN